MAPIFIALASMQNLDFVAMSEFLNTQKGQLFRLDITFHQYVNDPNYLIPGNGVGWVWPMTNIHETSSAFEVLSTLIDRFELNLYSVLELGTDPMFTLIDRTNTRI